MLRVLTLLALVGAASAFAPSSFPRNRVVGRSMRAAPLEAVKDVGSEADVSGSDVRWPRAAPREPSPGAWREPSGCRPRTWLQLLAAAVVTHGAEPPRTGIHATLTHLPPIRTKHA